MKKLLILCSVLFSFLLISDKVGATSVTAYYDSDYVQNNVLANIDLEYVDTELIPYINRNFQNYHVVLLFEKSSNNNFSLGYVYIMPRNYDNSGAFFMHVRNGYTSMLSYFPYQSINNLYEVSGRVRGYSLISFNALSHVIIGGNDDIITTLGSWLSNPSYSSPNSFNEFIVTMPVCNTSSCDIDFLSDDTNTALYGRLPYYSNYHSIMATTLAYKDYQGDFIIHYNGEDYTHSLGEVFPTYTEFIDTLIPNPVVNDFGDNSFGFKSNEISISDTHSSGTVNCPKNTDFVNDFCYTNVFNYSTDEDLDNAHLITQFYLSDNVLYNKDNYYIFTYRFDSDTLYLPTSASVSSGYNTTTLQIVKTNVITNGLYRDVQLVLQGTNDLPQGSSIEFIGLLFPTLGSYSPNYSSWHYGIYRSFKITDFGSSIPTMTNLNTDYSTNSLDSIGSNDTSWFKNFSVNDRGLSSFLTAPIRLFQTMRSSTCSNVILPLPHFGNITLPCLKSVFQQNLPDLLSLYQIIMSGIICYYVGLNYFRLIKNAFNPEDDRIEVQDL